MRRVLLALALFVAPDVAHAACKVAGVVKDAEGKPVVGARVVLEGAKGEARTGSDGAYAIEGAEGKAIRVAVALEDGAWFQLLRNRDPLLLRSDPFDAAGDCTRNFDAAAPAENYDAKALAPGDWPAAFALYQGFARAASFAKRLGVKPGPQPLLVNAWSATAEPGDASWTGPISFNPQGRARAQVNLGTAASGVDDNGRPTNREYHEFGHQALALALGTLPRSRDDLRNGGYYVNPTSADALAEGLATFFALMVRKHVDGVAEPRIVIEGATFDLDQLQRPWDHETAESLAVAAVLVDLEDGATKAESSDVELVSHSLVDDGTLIVGTLAGVEDGAPLVVTAGEHVGATSAVRVDDTIWFALPVPAGTGADTIAVVRGEAARPDDDTLDVAVEDIWRTIVSFRGKKPEGDGHILDVEDLHAALSAKFGAKVDALFIAHGLFADDNGNRTHDSGETPGLTSHPASDKGGAMLPRRRLPLPDALRIVVETQPAATRYAVHVRAGDRPGYAYVAAPQDGNITVAVPASGSGGTVTVIAFGPGHRPSVVAALQADAFWVDPPRSLSAELQAVPASVSTGTGGGEEEASGFSLPSVSAPLIMFVGGCACLLAGLIVMLTGRRRVRGHGPHL